jgi:hypothetical protein
MGGRLVTDTWLGNAADPPAETHDDVRRAIGLVTMTGIAAVALASAAILAVR